MDVQSEYTRWHDSPVLSESERAELDQVIYDEKERADRFYTHLKFGTGGLRGVLGMGTNRMNRYTVRRAARALALRVRAENGAEKGIVIAHDSRHMSDAFALETALAAATYGVKAYLFDALRPTPELSFAIRHLGAAAGVVITASHNPAIYNGFKAYGSDGGQITEATANGVLEEMARIDPLDVPMISETKARASGLLTTIGAAVDQAYIEHVLSLRPDPTLLARTGVSLKIVYTPLHGAGNIPVRRALKAAGFTDVTVVPEQEQPDGAFPTVAFPNPEFPEAFTLAIGHANRLGADLIVGTDPDSDRMGVMVKKGDEWLPLTGNQVGCLMLQYIASVKPVQPGDYAVTTVVSTRMIDAIAKATGIDVIRVLTGFKYIGETIERHERAGNHGFLLGFEESYGYLTGGYIRDKDAVIASVLICELAAYYKSKGMSLLDALTHMFETYGYYCEKTHSITLPGIDGMAKREAITRALRAQPPTTIGGRKVLRALDFLPGGVLGLPASDVLLYEMERDAWICIRPSGTEPKLKAYAGVRESDAETARIAADALIDATVALCR